MLTGSRRPNQIRPELTLRFCGNPFLIESSQPVENRLIQSLAPHRRLLVAFSGGVDSSVVLAAACRAQLDLLVAVTADSPSVPRWQIKLAQQIAGSLGVEHVLIPTGETQRADYQRNDSRRCYFCKETLYEAIFELARQRFGNRSGPRQINPNQINPNQIAPIAIASGTNADDLGDYRPGIRGGNQATGADTARTARAWQAVRSSACPLFRIAQS